MEDEGLIPFPRLSAATTAGGAAMDLALRPFGQHEGDLDVKFEGTPRPVLVTRLLECCTTNGGEERVPLEFFWALPVGKRIECLFSLFASATGREITVGFRCADAACSEEGEIALSVDEVSALQEDAYAAERIEVRVDDEVFVLRRPTGRDQLEWRARTFADGRALRGAMIDTLLLEEGGEGQRRPSASRRECLDMIEEAMEEHDPLVDFKLSVRCPSCEATTVSAIDLEELSLRGLQSAQRRLLASIHRLAAQYHWSEDQIFAVPVWRRATYLSLIANERSQ